MSGRAPRASSLLFRTEPARQAALFAAVVALLIDLVFYLALAEAQLAGGAVATWSAIKVLTVVAVVSWLAIDQRAWSLGLVAVVFVLIGLEDSIGVTAPLGMWLIEEAGIRRGPQGSNPQVLRRIFVTIGLLGPTVYLAKRAPSRLRKAVWILIAFLGLVFVAAVLGDLVADRTGTNLDEILEGPVLSLASAFSVGLVVEWWPQRRLRSPTTTRPRQRFRQP